MMNKIDVAVQSYKKPESLIYSLLTLHKYSKDYIDVVYIDDDQSGGGITDLYTNSQILNALRPWKVKVRANEKRAGLYFFTQGMLKKRIKNRGIYLYYKCRNRSPQIISDEDVRYQWAINSTDKKYILTIHDDVKFTGDVCGLYLSFVEDNIAEVGELGQCWRCKMRDHCNPGRVFTSSFCPYREWPLVKTLDPRYKRICRINEWAALIDVKIASDAAKKDSVYFGSFEDFGDTSAYWFDYVIGKGHRVRDPFTEKGYKTKDFFVHCWQGFSGHSVWEDQGNGVKQYQSEMIKNVIKNEYGLIL